MSRPEALFDFVERDSEESWPALRRVEWFFCGEEIVDEGAHFLSRKGTPVANCRVAGESHRDYVLEGRHVSVFKG